MILKKVLILIFCFLTNCSLNSAQVDENNDNLKNYARRVYNEHPVLTKLIIGSLPITFFFLGYIKGKRNSYFQGYNDGYSKGFKKGSLITACTCAATFVGITFGKKYFEN